MEGIEKPIFWCAIYGITFFNFENFRMKGNEMSILSYPNRGPWGDSKWRGNCSGYIYKELFERLKPQFLWIQWSVQEHQLK